MTVHSFLTLPRAGECKIESQNSNFKKIMIFRFGPSQIQPSVGDAGAPVFTFKGLENILQNNPQISPLKKILLLRIRRV